MAQFGVDELHSPQVEVEPPEKYFSKMDITPEQKEERVEATDDFIDVLLFLFALLPIEETYGADYTAAYEEFRMRFGNVVAKYSRMDEYMQTYVNERASDIFRVTQDRFELGEWWTSPDRATAIAESDANTILNYEELQQAAELGAVGKKWVNRDDNKVRTSHRLVTPKIIPLTEFFAVGNGVMQFPCDWANNPKECYNCRCSCHYYDKDGKVVKIVAHRGGLLNVIDSKFESERPPVSDDFITEESTDVDTSVKQELLTREYWVKRLSVLGEDDETTKQIADTIEDILEHRKETNYEDLAFVYTHDGSVLINKTYDYYKDGVSGCIPTEEMMERLGEAPKRTVIGIHNHPRSYYTTTDDAYRCIERNYKYGLAVCHNGTVFKYSYHGESPCHNIDKFSIGRRVAELSEIQYNDIGRTEEQIIEELEKLGFDWEKLP